MSTGLESIRQQLARPNEQERLTALSETLKHGQEGLDLLLTHSLKDPSETVQQSSYWVLHGENPVLTLPSNFKPSPTDTITSVAITPDNTILVGGSWKKIWVWQLQTGKVSKSLEGHSHWVLSVAISPDGKKLVSGSADNTIKIWDLETGKLIHTLSRHSSWVTAVAISPDGKTIVSGSADKTIKIWDLETGNLRKTLTDQDNLSSVLSLCISHDGKVIAAGSTNKKITLWDLQNGTLIRTLEGHSDWVQALIISPDNKTLISGSRDGYVKTWESKSEESSAKEAPAWQKGLIDIGASGIGFLCGGPIGIPLGLGALMLGRQIIHGLNNNNSDTQFPSQSLECKNSNSYYKQSINSIAYYFNSNLLILNFTKTIKSFDLKTNQIIYTLQQSKFISSIAISSSWKILVVAGRDWVILLNPQTGKPLHALKGCSYSKLSKIVISEVSKNLFFGESVSINIKGFDQNNQEISIKNNSVNWQISGGKIKQGLFIAGQREGTFEIKAKLDIFEDSISITILEPPKITHVEITPSNVTLKFGVTQKFEAVVRDQRDNPMNETVSWKVEGGGTIDQQGNFKAGYTSGKFKVTASVGSENKSIFIKIVEPPKLQELIFRSSILKLDVGQSFQFQVKGIDQYGNEISTGKITWSASSGTISKNGYFYPGNIERTVIIEATAKPSNAAPIKTFTEIQVYEPSRLTTIQINPSSVILQPGADQLFRIVGFDQRGTEMSVPSEDIKWRATAGSIYPSGYFSSSENQKGTCEIIVTARGLSATAKVTIPPILRQIEIKPKEIELKPEEEFKFTVTGVDQAGDPIPVINPRWTTTKGGSITTQGVFKGNYQEREVVVTVTFGGLSDTAIVTLTPVLRRLEIRPGFVYLRPGEQQTFTVKGFDQFDHEIEPGEVVWETTGGKIDQDGTLTVTQNEQGYFQVTAVSQSIPKHNQQVRKVLLYAGVSTKIIAWVLSHQKLLEDLLAAGSDSAETEKQLEESNVEEMQLDENTETIQETETIVKADEEVDEIDELEEFGEIDEMPKDESVVETEVLDFATALQQWCFHQLQKLASRCFSSISRFCFSEASANLSASADVFVLMVEYNPYQYFECLNTLYLDGSRCFPWFHCLKITPDGKKLITTKGNSIQIWDLKTGELFNTLKKHFGRIYCLAITPDGQNLVSGSWRWRDLNSDENWYSNIQIWDLNRGELLHLLDCLNGVILLDITLNSQILISGEISNIITFWNLNTREVIKTCGTYSSAYKTSCLETDRLSAKNDDYDYYFWYRNYAWWKFNMILTPDQKRVIIGQKIIKIYDLENGKLLTIIGKNVGLISNLVITPDGQTLISSYYETIRIWDLSAKPPVERCTLKTSAQQILALAIAPDGKRVISAGGRTNETSELKKIKSYKESEIKICYESLIEIWDLNTGEYLHSIREEFTEWPGIYPDHYIYNLIVTPDGKQIISGYADGTIKIWGVPELNLQIDDLEM